MLLLSSGNPIRIVSCNCLMVGSLVVCSLTLSQVTDSIYDNVIMARVSGILPTQQPRG